MAKQNKCKNWKYGKPKDKHERTLEISPDTLIEDRMLCSKFNT